MNSYTLSFTFKKQSHFMNSFEYVVVMLTLILGLGIAQILNGISDMVAHYNKIKFRYAHTIYIFVIFLVYIQHWWYAYQYSHEVEIWTLPITISLLGFPILLFLQSRFLFPTGSRSQETDMVAYFEDNWKWLYSLFILSIFTSIIHNIFISSFTWQEQLPLMIYMSLFLVFIIGNVKNRMAHNVFMTVQLIFWLVFVFFLEKHMLE